MHEPEKGFPALRNKRDIIDQLIEMIGGLSEQVDFIGAAKQMFQRDFYQ